MELTSTERMIAMLLEKVDRLTAERDEARREAEELRKETWDHGGAFGQYERDGE